MRGNSEERECRCFNQHLNWLVTNYESNKYMYGVHVGGPCGGEVYGANGSLENQAATDWLLRGVLENLGRNTGIAFCMR